MKNFRTTILSALFTSILLIVPLISLAQGTQNPGGGTQNLGTQNPTSQTSQNYKISIPSPLKICNPPGAATCSLSGLINVIITDIVTPIGGIIAVLMIMYAGFLFVTAQGAPAQISKAKDTLLYAAIGAAILLGANVIAIAIKTTVDKLG